MPRVGPSAAGGTRYGCDIRSGGTIYPATDSPGGRGDHPRRDSTIERPLNVNRTQTILLVKGIKVKQKVFTKNFHSQ